MCAAYRNAWLYARFADRIASMGAPEGLSAERVGVYQEVLGEISAPIQEKAALLVRAARSAGERLPEARRGRCWQPLVDLAAEPR